MPRLRPIASVLTAVLVLAFAGAAAAAPSGGSGRSVFGPDVASFQHPGGASINWSAVRGDKVSFAFVKATEGTTYTNPYFAGDYRSARRAGLVRSAYHYARPAEPVSSAVDQANAFLRVAGTAGSQGDLPLTLDLEQSGGLSPSQLVAWTRAFLSRVQSQSHRQVIIYTYPYFWQTAMGDSTAFASQPLWIASYRSGGPARPLPGGWSRWTFWQYTDQGQIPGIAAAVDESLFAGSPAELAAMGRPGSASGGGGSGGGLPIPLPLPLPPLPIPLTLPGLGGVLPPATSHANG